MKWHNRNSIQAQMNIYELHPELSRQVMIKKTIIIYL